MIVKKRPDEPCIRVSKVEERKQSVGNWTRGVLEIAGNARCDLVGRLIVGTRTSENGKEGAGVGGKN